jgi:hypothetical protein
MPNFAKYDQKHLFKRIKYIFKNFVYFIPYTMMMFDILVNKSNKLCLVMLLEQILYIHTQKAKMCQIEGFIKQLFF